MFSTHHMAFCFTPVAVASLLLALIAGCTHQTAIVTEADPAPPTSANPTGWRTPPADLTGIPFFAKKGVCNQESIWLEPQYTLTLSMAVDGEPALTRSLILSRSGYEKAKTQAVLKIVQGITGHYKLSELSPGVCPAALERQLDALASDTALRVITGLDTGSNANHQTLKDAEALGNTYLIANTADTAVAVDYSHRYYLNTNSPWNGTAQVDAKLAPDGTLSEGSVQRDDETLSTIITGITSLVGDFTGAGAAAAAAAPAAAAPAAAARVARAASSPCPADGHWPEVSKEVKYVYSLKTTLYRHDHKKQSDLGPVCAVASEGLTDGSFVVTLQKPDDDSSGKKPSKAFQFSGQVTPPEAAAKKDDSGN